MATIAASENEFPKVLFTEGAAAATPGTGLVVAYAKSDGLLYFKDDAGTEYPISQAADLAAHLADTSDAHDASAISVLDSGAHFTATDVEAALAELYAAIGAGGIPATIIDAAGDLIVGTAADTAGRLAKGAAGAYLSTYNGTLSWNGGTSFPASPATGDRYWRSDLGFEYYYDGTRWLTVQLFSVGYSSSGTISGTTDIRMPAITGTDVVYGVDFRVQALVATTNNGSNYWNFDLKKMITTTATVIVNVNTSTGVTAGEDTGLSGSINAVITGDLDGFQVRMIKQGSPGTLNGSAMFRYRLVGT